MSIRFVELDDPHPAKPTLQSVGTRILFTMVNGLVKPREIIEPNGEHVYIGVMANA